MSLLHTYPPLDFSFLHLTSITQLLQTQPNDATSTVQSPPLATSQLPSPHSPQNTKSKADSSQQQENQPQSSNPQQLPDVIRALQLVRADATGQSLLTAKQQAAATATTIIEREPIITNGLKLSYNNITNLQALDTVLPRIVDHAIQQLRWLDLSYNQLTTLVVQPTAANLNNTPTTTPTVHLNTTQQVISPTSHSTSTPTLTTPTTTNIQAAIHQCPLLQFTQLTVLYLQSNNIHDLQLTCALLSRFPLLQKLQLQGNPLYDSTYNGGIQKPRAYIIGMLRELRSLDSVTITVEERRAAELYVKTQIKYRNITGNKLYEKTRTMKSPTRTKRIV